MKKQIANLKNKIHIESSSQLTDYQYSSNGANLAVSDSDGNIYIYHKVGEGYMKTGQFSADDASVWKLAWAHPKYGKTLAIGSFKKKVAIFQERNNQWIETAFHTEHQGSVNCLCWAPISYGLKLFAGGSDGKVSILELQGNGWKVSSFVAHQWAINSMAVQDLPLNQGQANLDLQYPRIATASKDSNINIWGRTKQSQNYKITASHAPHKQMIRSILWRPSWGNQNSDEFQIVSCSQDGSVKILAFDGKKGFKSQIILLDQELPVSRISQSLTGNEIIISAAGGPADSEVQTYIFEESDKGKWDCIQTFGQI